MSELIRVPDVPEANMRQFGVCFHQQTDRHQPETMLTRCNYRVGHAGGHSWERRAGVVIAGMSKKNGGRPPSGDQS